MAAVPQAPSFPASAATGTLRGRRLASIPWPMALVVGAYCVLSIGYSVVVPILEVPDELGHNEYALYLATFQRLPQLPNRMQETHQPPLYYVLLVPILVLLGYDEPMDFYLNPDYMSIPINPEGVFHGGPDPRLFVHFGTETFPYQGYSLAVHLMRLVSVVLGAGVVLSTYALSFALFPGDRARAVAAAAIVGFIPYFNLLSGAVTNDSLANLVGALVILHVARLLVAPDGGWRRWLVLGGLYGLAILTKQSLLVLIPFAFLTLFVPAGRPWQRLRGAVALAVGTLAVSGWYLLWNLFHYGEPILLAVQHAQMQALGHVVTRRHTTLYDWWLYANDFAALFHDTFWGKLGIYNLPLPGVIYTAYDLLVLLAIAGLGRALWRARPACCHPGRRPALWVLGLMLPAQMAAILYRDQSYFGAQGRYLYVVLPVIGLFLATGLLAHFPGRGRALASGAIACGFALIGAWVVFAFLPPAYARPHGLPPEHLGLRIVDGRALSGTSVLHGQSFVAAQAGLSGVEVRLTTYGGTVTAPITLRLRAEPGPGPDLAVATLDSRQLADRQYAIFAFEPRRDSAGRTYYFVLDSPQDPPQSAPAIYGTHERPPGAIERYLNGQPAPGSLQFRLVFAEGS